MKEVLFLTLRQLWRDRRLPVALATLAILVATSLVLDVVRAEARERDRHAAERLDAETFLEQGARNPHTVAHFSRFAFRPRVATNNLDTGVSEHVGVAVWMEAHAQDPANARPAEDLVDIGRLALLDLAWIWQVLVPLLLIALGFDAISRERERRTLALTLVGGGSITRLVGGKLLALAATFMLALVLTALAALAAAPGLEVPDAWSRTAWWVGGYLAYVALWAVIVLAASAWARSSRSALTGLLALWATCVLIAPRTIATLVDERVPVPSGDDLKATIASDLEKGFDGHAPSEQRAKEFEARVLAQYGVQSLEELPVSFAGLSLSEGERVGNLVFDKRYRELAAIYERQRRWRRAASWLSPVPALQHLSMAAAGTDVEHHVDFTVQAERQRREIVERLNADMTRNAKGKDFDYLAGPELWATIPQFRYVPPPLTAGSIAGDAAVLGLWLLAGALAMALGVQRLSREVVA
jgi:ABC-2 type transport system permease protein